MCGIVGYWPVAPEPEAGPAFARLFEESIVRGMHAYGIAQPYGENIAYIRTLNRTEVQCVFDPKAPAIAHARYSQSGDWRNMENNQPIVVGNRALAHNGVIHMGTKAEFEAAFDVQCEADNDSEIFLRCLEKEDAMSFIMRIEGSFAGVWIDNGKLWAGRNERRPLWKCSAYGAVWYASTADIFKRAGFPEAQEAPVGVQTPLGIRIELV